MNQTITGFIRSTPAALLEIGKQYAPEMDERTLENCRRFFANDLRRDPTEGELRLLADIAAGDCDTPSTTLFSDVLTNDTEIAKTLADLMAKRAVLCADYHTPCSLDEVISIAKQAVGKAESRIALSCRQYPMLDLASRMMTAKLVDGNIREGFAIGSHVAYDTTPVGEGDRIYAILKSKNFCEDFDERLSALAACDSFVGSAKQILPIGRGGLLKPLLSLELGFEASLTRLQEDTDHTALTRDDCGLLVILQTSAAADMLMQTIEAELRPTYVGNIRSAKSLSCHLQTKEGVLVLPLSFVRSLFTARAYRAQIADKAVSYAVLHTECSTETDHIAIRATGEIGSPYYTALYTALTAISSCIAQGAMLGDIHLVERIAMPKDPQKAEMLGDCLAGLLGLYRIMTELSLTDCHCALGETTAPFTAYAAIPTSLAVTRSTLTSDDSKIYLLEPLYRGKLPDFEDLVKMYGYLNALRRDGLVLSARAVSGDVLETLEAMSENGLTEYLRREPLTALPGSILVETRSNIQGTLLAKTCPVETEETDRETGSENEEAPPQNEE